LTQTLPSSAPHGPLAVPTFGAGPSVLALHGFTHTGAQFRQLAALLERTVHAPDLPGHGGSAGLPTNLTAVLGALTDLLDDVGPAPVIGYSQGGRLALLLALHRPDLVSGVVALSASPGVEDRAARRAADEDVANRLEEDGLDAFLDSWLRAPVTGTTHLAAVAQQADRAAREENTARGLAAALRGYGQGAQPYIADRLDAIQPRCLFVAGERDQRYVGLAEMMADRVPEGMVELIRGAGHNVLLDDLAAVATVVRPFV